VSNKLLTQKPNLQTKQKSLFCHVQIVTSSRCHRKDLETRSRGKRSNHFTTCHLRPLS